MKVVVLGAASGETVVSVSVGVRTPSGKVDVIPEWSGKSRAATWGAQTEISVTRAAQGTLPGAELITAAEHASRLASAPLRPTVAQRPLDDLFGDGAAQLDLVIWRGLPSGRIANEPPAIRTGARVQGCCSV
jgi:hypothetical protein